MDSVHKYDFVNCFIANFYTNVAIHKLLKYTAITLRNCHVKPLLYIHCLFTIFYTYDGNMFPV